MTKCDKWFQLLFGKIAYLGQFYAEFTNDRVALVAHLETCESCQKLLGYVSQSTSASDLKKLSEADFITTIKRLRDTAIAKSQGVHTP